MRNNLRALAASELAEADRNAGRTEVLPVQWRKHLTLDVRSLSPPDACPPRCAVLAAAMTRAVGRVQR